jgi:hypothetical protein
MATRVRTYSGRKFKILDKGCVKDVGKLGDKP